VTGPGADEGFAERLEALRSRIASVRDDPGSVRLVAVTKGFAIGSAALTALALYAAYTESVGLKAIDLLDAKAVVDVVTGASAGPSGVVGATSVVAIRSGSRRAWRRPPW